ncbi:MAG: hypothetical protein HC838_09900 [Spirulinaceae cyanobacterium RM2_2_10]|nr:hypothetical protein [Spirulinaceae cyanobacterium RM2_2_10]
MQPSSDAALGGVAGYPVERLYREVALIAYHFHWSRAEILALDHAERLRWVQEILAILKRQPAPNSDE